MEQMTYSDFRQHLARTLDRVADNHTPVMITRQSRAPAIVISLSDFRSYEETAHLMSSMNNANRLNQAIEQLNKQQGQSHSLIDDDA